MANVTLYVKDADLELVSRAKSELGDSLSSVFVDCVRERLASRATTLVDASLMERITLDFWNENDEPTIQKSFIGRWLVGGTDKGLRADDDTQNWDAGAEWSVAQTKKNAIVVYVRHCNGGLAPQMEVYGSFAEFRDAKDGDQSPLHPQNVIAEAAGALGEPYEIELDI